MEADGRRRVGRRWHEPLPLDRSNIQGTRGPAPPPATYSLGDGELRRRRLVVSESSTLE